MTAEDGRSQRVREKCARGRLVSTLAGMTLEAKDAGEVIWGYAGEVAEGNDHAETQRKRGRGGLGGKRWV